MHKLIAMTTLLAIAAAAWGAEATKPATRPAKVVVVVLDFAGDDSEPTRSLADSIRIRLAKHADAFTVIDRLTTQELAPDRYGDKADAQAVGELLQESFSASVALVGTVSKRPDGMTARIRCIAPGGKGWTQEFRGDAQRYRALIATAVVEKLTGHVEWRPRERGEEAEPKDFGAPENVNGDFEKGAKGWDRPDNVSTFLEDGGKGHGTVLRMRNDLALDPWLEYRRALRFGKADPNDPPEIPQDTSMGGLAGFDGCDYVGEFFKAIPGQRYWLVADTKGGTGAMMFMKGWRKTESALDGLGEAALAELKLTPEQFAKLPDARRKALIEADAKKHPMRYLREVWRWRLTCPGGADWSHVAEPFPPRGGLMKEAEFLHVKILTIWPPGEQWWDNIHVYKDPRQKAPLPEEKPRTPSSKPQPK